MMKKIFILITAILAIEVAAQVLVRKPMDLQVYTHPGAERLENCVLSDERLDYTEFVGSIPLNECGKVTYLNTDYFISANCNVTEQMLADRNMSTDGYSRFYAYQLLYYQENCTSTPLALTTGFYYSDYAVCLPFNAQNSPIPLLVRFRCPPVGSSSTTVPSLLLIVWLALILH